VATVAAMGCTHLRQQQQRLAAVLLLVRGRGRRLVRPQWRQQRRLLRAYSLAVSRGMDMTV
jgi:hypothetical protein